MKINFVFKQMGQTHVNKLFKLLLNSQRVPFKISMGCQIWCLITQGSRKVERTELCESLGDGMMAGHVVTSIIHGALMDPWWHSSACPSVASHMLVFASHKTQSVLKARTDYLFIPVSLSLDSWKTALCKLSSTQQVCSGGLKCWAPLLKSLQINTLEIVLVSRRWVML